MSENAGERVTGNPGEVAKAAAAAVAPDAITADLLAKHAAGQKLDSAGYGRIGAWKAKAQAIFRGKGDAPGQPTPARPGQPAAVGAVAPAQTSGNGLPLVAADAVLAQRTTSAVLKRLDAITVRWITREAGKAGATGKTLSDFQCAASLAAPDRELLSDLSPDILAELGLSPRQFPIVTAASVIGLHGLNLWQCVSELKEMQIDARVKRLKEEGGRAVSTPTPAVTPRPANPPGATEIFCETPNKVEPFNEKKNPNPKG